MNASHISIRVAARWAILAVVLSATSGCSLIRRSDGPFLRAGPIGPRPGYAPAPVLEVSDYLAAEPGIPAGFTAGDGLRLLPGAEIPGIGPARALVVSISLGGQPPYFDERALERRLFGSDFAIPGTVAYELHEASAGKLRFAAGVLPTLIDTRPLGRFQAPAPEDLARLAREALMSWGRDTSLVEFDDDGPDGIPHSADDDGRLDVVFLAIESEARFASQTVRGGFTIESPYGSVRVGTVHVIWVPRGGALDPVPTIGLALGALGLDAGERFFPAGSPRLLSSVARARLGWLPVQPLLESGTLQVPGDGAVAVPLQGLVFGAGMWLVEGAGDHVYASRIARKGDGHYQVTAFEHGAQGEEQVLALNRQLGLEGPRAYVSWPWGRSAFVELLREGGARTAEDGVEPGSVVAEGGVVSAISYASPGGTAAARDLSGCNDGLPLAGVPAACFYALMRGR